MANKKDVIITVYVESPSPSPANSHPKTDQFMKISRKPHQTARKGGYDRRAHLLAYSQQLRSTGGSQQVQWPKTGSKTKIKLGSKRVRTPLRLRRTKGIWRYQRLVPEVDISCNDRKRATTGSKTNSSFLKTLRCVLRGISGCSKGSKVAEKNLAV